MNPPEPYSSLDDLPLTQLSLDQMEASAAVNMLKGKVCPIHEREDDPNTPNNFPKIVTT
jgi:hypothetical protein